MSGQGDAPGDREGFVTEDRSVYRGWSTVLAAVLGLAFGPSVILMMSFGVFAPAINAEFNWGIARISFGATIMALMLVVVSPVQGFLVDRFGARRVILVSQPLFGLGVIALAFLPADIRLFYFACTVLPLLAIGLWPLSYNRLASSWFDRRLGLALGVTNTGVGLGATFVPVLIGAIFISYDWRVAYASLGAVVLLVVWPVAIRLLREGDHARSARSQVSAPAGLTMAEVVRERSFWMLLAAFFGLGIMSSAIVMHQVSMLLDRGLSMSATILFQSVLGISSIAGRIVAGWLLDRIHLSRLMAIILLPAFGACLLYATTTSAPLLLISAIAFGFIIGAEFDVLGYALRRYYGLLSFGRIWGFVYAVFQIGGALGTFGPGLIRDATGAYAPAMLTLAGLSLIIAVIFFRMPSYRFVHSEQPAADDGPPGTGSFETGERSEQHRAV